MSTRGPKTVASARRSTASAHGDRGGAGIAGVLRAEVAWSIRGHHPLSGTTHAAEVGSFLHHLGTLSDHRA